MSTSHSGVLCKNLYNVFEQAGASIQQQATWSLPVGALSSVHYPVQACFMFALLFSFSSRLSVQTSPPTYSDFQNKRYQSDSKPESKPENHLLL